MLSDFLSDPRFGLFCLPIATCRRRQKYVDVSVLYRLAARESSFQTRMWLFLPLSFLSSSPCASVCMILHLCTCTRARARIWLCMQMCSQMLIAPARQRGIHPAVQAQCLERGIVAIERASLRHMGVSCVWMRPCVRARALERVCVCAYACGALRINVTASS